MKNDTTRETQFDMLAHILEGYEKDGRAAAFFFLQEHDDIQNSEIQKLKDTLEESMYDTFGMSELAEELSCFLERFFEKKFQCLDIDIDIEDAINQAFCRGVDSVLAEALGEPEPQAPSR